MLSIQGQSFAEMFGNLSRHEALDGPEKSAAADIAGWFTRRDEIRAAREAERRAPDYDPCSDDTDPEGDHARRDPFFGDTSPECQTGREWRTWVHGDVRFTVYPYTTGGTMNVGVDRIDRRKNVTVDA